MSHTRLISRPAREPTTSRQGAGSNRSWTGSTKAIVLSHYAAVDATGLTHLDGIWTELMPGTGMDRLDLLLRLVQFEGDRIDNIDGVRDPQVAGIVAAR
jgi:hypothetical protein